MHKFTHWKRRLPFMRVLLLLLLLLTASPAFALKFYVDGLMYTTINNSKYVSVSKGGNDPTGDLVIPSTVEYIGTTYRVTTIGDHAFYYCGKLTSITIPASVTSIEKEALFGCSALVKIEVENSSKTYTSAEGVLFNKAMTTLICCPGGKTKVTIPDGVTSIGKGAFYGCSRLTSINIPDRVTSIGDEAFKYCSGLTSVTIPGSVTSIGNSAFHGCTGLTSVTIPGSVTSIGNSAFHGCTGLTSVTIPGSVTSISQEAFYDCRGLTSVTILDGVTSIGDSAFYCCFGLTSITIPSSVTYIGGSAFLRCTSLTSVTVPEGVTSILDNTFRGCSGLTSVTIPSSVTSICDYAFSGCSGLTSITIPDVVTFIGESAFWDCSGLTSLTLPESVKKIGGNCFKGCSLRPLKILSKDAVTFDKNAFSEMKSESEIACYSVNYQNIKSLWKGSGGVYMIDGPMGGFQNITEYYCGVSFVYNNPYYEGKTDEIELCAEITGTDIKDTPVALNKENYIDGLKFDTKYTLRVYEKANPENSTSVVFTTKKTTVKVDYTPTVTTINIESIKADNDKSCQAPKITVGGKEYKGGTMKLTGLRPNQSVQVKADYDGTIISQDIRTKDITVNISTAVVYPNAIECEGTYWIGDAKLAGVKWTCDGETVSTSKKLVMTGLRPDREYSVTFTVKVACGDGSTYTKYKYLTKKTAELELEMLTPKSVGNGKTIVAAKTNISENETNVGFEWKKYDAPATLPYSRGFSVICDGHLEGLIQNLQPTYYIVRAFYCDAYGNYYYSPVTSFDPTDSSYFEPTVRTYPAETEDNKVTLRGYALAGTDNITSQGFQYWIVQGAKHNAAGYGAPASDADIKTVKVDGQRMEVTLSGLESGATYAYRAFVETEAGMTYGEEQIFETPVVEGIEDVKVDDAEVTIVGYFDINGRRFDAPQRGFNIVVYSDGTARKIISK